MGIDSTENFLFLKFTQGSNTKALLADIEKIAGDLAKDPESFSKNLYIICIVDNMKNRIFLEKCFLSNDGKTMKKNLRKEMKAWKGTVNFLYILDNNYGEQDIKLINLNRFELIQMPPMKYHINWEVKEAEENINRGYVTSIQLFQLVEIYNKIGDKLFKRNVRYGLNEQLGVDRAIKDTLRNSPHEFWFKNNGITILIEWPGFKLDRVEEILLEHIPEYGELQFSVINGAQTITASAQCLYEMEYELEELRKKGDELEVKKLEEKIKKSREAKVLLRILHIPHSRKNSDFEGRNTKEVNEISVALNRQKPIKAEDIAFASPFVEKLAAFLEREQINGKRYFRLVKCGEGSAINRAVDLADFARARKAYAGYPGDARSMGTNTLLRFKNGVGNDYTFHESTIFVPEWMEAEEEQETEVFEKYYGAVYFAVRVADFYSKNYKKIEVNDAGKLAVLQNGKWYFTAYIVQLFNGFREDYSQFTDCFEMIRDKLMDLMKLFSEQCYATSWKSEEFKKLDSNTFKNEGLFLLTRKEASVDEFARIINSTLADDEIFEFTSYQEVTAEAQIGQKNQITSSIKQVNSKVKFIKLNGAQIERVNSTAHAMVKSVQFVLDNYPGHEEELLQTGRDWFTDDSARAADGFGYLKQCVEITDSSEKSYWVGTHSNSPTKYKQMRILGETAGVKERSIFWFAADGETQIFSW